MKTVPPSPPAPSVPQPCELVLLAVLALLLMMLLGASGAFYLFSRHFWLDEIYTHTLVTDPDFGHSMRALAGGVETHPPALYVLLRAFTWVAGSGEVAFRSFVFLAALAGLVGIYCFLRLSFAPLAAFAAVLGVWCHPLIVHHAFDARFYVPLFTAVVWYAYFLVVSRNRPRSWPKLAVAACAILVCTLHYYGIIALVLVTAGEFVARRARGWAGWNGFVAAAAGPVALLACMPMLLSQRAALTVPTWIDSPTWDGVVHFFKEILFQGYLAAVVLAAWLSHLVWSLRHTDLKVAEVRGNIAVQAGLAVLVLLPFVLLVVTYAVQPTLVPRYGVPAVAALAPAIAYGVARASRGFVLVLCAVFVLAAYDRLRFEVQDHRKTDQATDQLIADIRQQPGEDPVVVEDPHILYRIWYYAPDLRGRCFFLDFERGQLRHSSPRRVFGRDLARKFAEFYGSPALLKWDEVGKRSRVYWVPASPEPELPFRSYRGRPVDRAKHLFEIIANAPGDERR